jgi:hypothetical protein
VPVLTDVIRYCDKCHALFFHGKANVGVCPADGRHHYANDTSFRFVLSYNVPETPTGQTSWRRCQKCQVIFFDGYSDKGRCDAGDAHDGDLDYDFMMPHDFVGSLQDQKAWEYCTKCKAMFYDGYPDRGHCAAGAGHERDPNAYRFLLPHGQPSGLIDDSGA